MFKISPDAVGPFLQPMQMGPRFPFQFGLTFRRLPGLQDALQVAVQQFTRIQFGRIDRQVKDLDSVPVGLQPGSYRLAPVHLEVIQDQESLLRMALSKTTRTYAKTGIGRALVGAERVRAGWKRSPSHVWITANTCW